MTNFKHTLFTLSSALVLGAGLALGGCAADAGANIDDSYPHENIEEVQQDANENSAADQVTDEVTATEPVRQFPVIVFENGEATQVAWAIELPDEIGEAHDEAIAATRAELAWEGPVTFSTHAETGSELVLVPIDPGSFAGAETASAGDLWDCSYTLEDGSRHDALCCGEDPGAVEMLTADDLREAGFDPQAHAQLPLDATRDLGEPPVAIDPLP